MWTPRSRNPNPQPGVSGGGEVELAPKSQPDWSEAHAARLLWRAGFGPRPHQAAHLGKRGKQATIDWLMTGGPDPSLVGPEPRVDGRALDPVNEFDDGQLWWIDRMVRAEPPLWEKLTLFWHDHFATNQPVAQMLIQNATLRLNALGDFPTLLHAVTYDPAMQKFLSLLGSNKKAPNENFARELMELFTLGDSYTEQDIREAARALTGFRGVAAGRGLTNVTFDGSRHDTGIKRIFGQAGNYGPDDVLALVVAHPNHAPFLVEKLWEFFIASPLDGATQSGLVDAYVGSGHQIAPVVRAILEHPALYARLDRPDLVKSPPVFVAGALRAAGRGIETADPADLMAAMGMRLFKPPSVAGWDWGTAWLSTGMVRARFAFASYISERQGVTRKRFKDPAAALAAAQQAAGSPWTSPQTNKTLTRMAAKWRSSHDQLQRALFHLLLSGPDAQVH